MADNFTRLRFDKLLNVEKIVTLFYMELSKSFSHSIEKHDFWEMVYIDKGEMVCTAGKNRFVLKSGELTFHQPNEPHNLSGNGCVAPNVSIITFECHSRAMQRLQGKIFKPDAQEKALLSQIVSEGLSCYRLADIRNPLLQTMEKIVPCPLGSSQMTKNLLEIFLIRLCRRPDVLTKKMRQSYVIDGVDVPQDIKQILDFLMENVYGKITIADVALYVGKSESAVKQLFSRYRDGGIIRYYNELKIREARRLIREGNYSFTQISDMLHYNNPQYFSKCFKEFTQMTPREYKASIVG